MRIKIKRFDKELPLPEYKTEGAAAFDLCARETVEIAPRAVAYIPLNVAIEIPDGYMILIAPRSSLHKRGIFLANHIGVVDPDFRGDEDEYHAALYNYLDKPVTIGRGDRIVQALIKKFEKAEWDEVESLGNKTRGGFGTTGLK